MPLSAWALLKKICLSRNYAVLFFSFEMLVLNVFLGFSGERRGSLGAGRYRTKEKQKTEFKFNDSNSTDFNDSSTKELTESGTTTESSSTKTKTSSSSYYPSDSTEASTKLLVPLKAKKSKLLSLNKNTDHVSLVDDFDNQNSTNNTSNTTATENTANLLAMLS